MNKHITTTILATFLGLMASNATVVTNFFDDFQDETAGTAPAINTSSIGGGDVADVGTAWSVTGGSTVNSYTDTSSFTHKAVNMPGNASGSATGTFSAATVNGSIIDLDFEVDYTLSGSTYADIIVQSGSTPLLDVRILRGNTWKMQTVTTTSTNNITGFVNVTGASGGSHYWRHLTLNLGATTFSAAMNVEGSTTTNSATGLPYFNSSVPTTIDTLLLTNATSANVLRILHVDNVRVAVVTGTPVIAVPASATVPATMVGTTRNYSVMVTNTGDATLSISAAGISGTDAARFSVVSYPSSVAPSATGTIVVSYTPNAVATHTASLDITSDGGSPSVSLSGSGAADAPVDVLWAQTSIPDNNWGTAACWSSTNALWNGSAPNSVYEAAVFTGTPTKTAAVLNGGTYTIGQVKVTDLAIDVKIRDQQNNGTLTLDPSVVFDGVGIDMSAAAHSFTISDQNSYAQTWTLRLESDQEWRVTSPTAGADLLIEDSTSSSPGSHLQVDLQGHTLTNNVGAGHFITVNQPIVGSGGIVKIGSGTLVLGSTNTYTYSGNTTINGGTLALTNSGSLASTNITVATNAAFDVSGVSGGNYALNGSGTLTLSIAKSGSNLSQGHVVAGGNTVTANGTLTVSASGDALADGDTFTLFNVQPSGTFAATNLPTVPATGTNWLIVNNYQTLTYNVWPTAGTATYTHSKGISQKFTVAELLTHVTGATNSKTITLTSLAGQSDLTSQFTLASGAKLQASGPLSGSGTLILYSPASSDADDSFGYAISDGRGGASSGTVNLHVTTNSVFGQQGPQMTADGNGHVTLKFYGVPGYTYWIQRASNSEFTQDVTELGPYDATAESPVITATDTISPSGSAFYRLEWKP